jgi:hypothetical protein|tara:strand:- start:159 stop:545 length:387 start_codon:yes stop_codon:yes gene_type:complete
MDINSAFPTKYMKAADLPEPKTFTIRVVSMERMMDGTQKPAIAFHETDQLFVLNKTNANRCAAMWGSDTNTWTNQRIELYKDFAEFQGRTVDSIRCRAPQTAAPQQPTAAPAAPSPATPPAGDGDIPF